MTYTEQIVGFINKKEERESSAYDKKPNSATEEQGCCQSVRMTRPVLSCMRKRGQQKLAKDMKQQERA
jgi:hypothetical protein